MIFDLICCEIYKELNLCNSVKESSKVYTSSILEIKHANSSSASSYI